MTPLRITGHSIACPAGIGVSELTAALRERRSGLRPNDFGESPLPTWIGRVPGIEAVELPRRLAEWDCRNNRLAWLALTSDSFLERAAAARIRYGADRVALVMGTGRSRALEKAVRGQRKPGESIIAAVPVGQAAGQCHGLNARHAANPGRQWRFAEVVRPQAAAAPA